jgi:hypothetical protein
MSVFGNVDRKGFGMSRWYHIFVVLGIAVIAFLALATLYVHSVEPIQVMVEARFIVVSQDTALWLPGNHAFTLDGEINSFSPLETTVPITGSGTVDYSMQDDIGPPGWFMADIHFEGNIPEHPILGGPIALDGRYTGQTILALVDPEPYVRTEQLFHLWAYAWLEALWDPTYFNVTDGNFTINFISISPDGLNFEIDVNGTATVIPAEDPEPVPESTVVIALMMLAPVVVYQIKRAT